VVSRAEDVPDPAVVVVNPDDEVTPEAFCEWLDQLQSGEPIRWRHGCSDVCRCPRRRRGVTPVVIDPSAGVELVADTVRHRAACTAAS